ncbi:MAG: L-seryl-tRNA(Sec) selenium transferase, partial [Actinomycetota bacterium]|nr:L-seryl-tRNA(Sec) selenium transferase [Actinomycetota bacterium]
ATPTAAALAMPVAKLRERAAALAGRLGRAGHDARAVDTEAAVGGGGAPGVRLPSAAVSLPAHYAESLRRGSPAVVGRVEQGRCLLDLRALAAADDDVVCAAVLAVRT